MLGDSQNQICWGYQRIQGSIDFVAYNLKKYKEKWGYAFFEEKGVSKTPAHLMVMFMRVFFIMKQ